MIISDFLRKLRDNNIDISLNGENLEVHSNEPQIPAEFLDTLRANKEDIILYLKEKVSTKDFSSISPVAESSSYALSSSQYRLWILSHFEDGNVAYNIPRFYEFDGDLDVKSLEHAFAELIDRHEVLRTVIKEDESGVAKQFVLSSDDDKFRMLHLDLKNESDAISAARREIQKEMESPFDLSNGPLFRVKLLHMADEKYILSYVMHHIVSDGWSMQIILKELLTLYNSFSNGGGNTLEPLKIQYKDYAAWQIEQLKGENLKTHRAYWEDQFSGELPSFELSGDLKRPLIKTYNGQRLQKIFNKSTTAGLKQLVKNNDATLFMGLLSSINALFYKYSDQTDIIVGTATAGRDHIDLEDQIGFYINTLAIRSRFEPSDSFLQVLQKTREVTLGAYEHQVYPFDQLVEDLSLTRDRSRSTLFDVMVDLQSIGSESKDADVQNLGGLRVESYTEVENEVVQFDLTFTFSEMEEQLFLILEYNSDIYTIDIIESLLSHLETVFESVIDTPDKSLEALSLLNAEERKQLLIDFNNTEKISAKGKTLVDLFESQVVQTPDNIAVEFNGGKLTYYELNERSNQLADYLRKEHRIESNDLVTICLDRSVDMIISIFGVLKSGAAYVPVDIDYPEDRKAFMIENSNCKVVLDEEELEMFDLKRSRYSKTNLGLKIDSSDLAYVIYTSGSTGKPKGVQVKHSSVVNYMDWVSENYINLDKPENFGLFTSLSFDLTVTSIYGALLNGASLTVFNSSLETAELLKSYLNEASGLGVIKLTPSHISLIDSLGIPATKISKAIVGGEELNVHQVRILRKLNPEIKIYNEYGPTEATVGSVVWEVPKNFSKILIGAPISNTQIHIVNAQNELQPIGVLGELCISGDGLAKGYLDNDALTDEKFIENPFNKGGKLYKTGDLAKWLPDGNLMYAGRKDDQVKIRGYRVEPGEIENALLSIDGVQDAVVLLAENEAQEKHLAAFVTGRSELNSKDLIEALRADLPEYMIPSEFIQLEEIPLTSNGKVNKNELLKFGGGSMHTGTAFVAPRNATEEKLAEIWSAILNTEKSKLSVKDNFFDLGGHSLRATRLTGQIHKVFSVKLGLNEVFNTPTIEDQAILVDNSKKDGYSEIIPVELKESYDLSSSQKRLWVLSQFEEANIAYNLPGFHELEGAVDVESLSFAFRSLIERHEILRTVFKEDENGEIKQFIQSIEEINFEIQSEDLRGTQNREEKIEEIVHLETKTAFDLENGPLLRVRLIQLEDEKFVLCYVMHHIVSDGWSMEVMIHEWLVLYNSFVNGNKSTLEPLKIQYKDYAAWQQNQLAGDNLATHRNFWLNELSGELPVLELIGDNQRPIVKTYNGSRVEKQFNSEVANKFKTLCQSEGSTLFMGLLAAVDALLYRVTHQNDIIIGSVLAGRDHSDLENQIGYYLNTIVFRVPFTGENSFREILKSTRKTALEAYDHQVYPFDQLIEDLALKHDLSRNPLFDVSVVLQDISSNFIDMDSSELNEIKVQEYEGAQNLTSKMDLSFTFMENEQGLISTLDYNTDIYAKESIDRLLNLFEQLLEAITNDPNQSLDELEYISQEEKRTLLEDFNATQTNYPADATLVSLFEAQVEKTLENIAVVFEGTRITYSELNERSNQLADYLRSTYGIQRNDLVGIKLNRGEQMIITILGVLKSGAAYLPIDLEYPEDRISYIIQDSGCKLVVDEEELEMFQMKRSRFSKSNLEKINDVIDLAYVIYTSGSTGKPKGVEVQHKGIVNTMCAQIDAFGVGESDNCLQFASFSFDASVSETFIALLSGASVHIASVEQRQSPELFIDFLNTNSISVATIPPSFMNQLDVDKMNGFKSLITAGESPSFSKVSEVLKKTDYFNAYGPTESSICATILKVDKNTTLENKLISIGTPISNTQIHIVDRHLKLVPIGVVGEICIGGNGLAKGYLNRPELTDEKFMENPYNSGSRIYRTGDLGRWRADGSIEFIGRIDDQVKIRGHRVELGEIENALQKFADVESAVVLAATNEAGDQNLVAYITSEIGLVSADLKEFLKQFLPEYMIPDNFVQLESMPLTPNGKIDKNRLRITEGKGLGTGQEYVAPRNEIEEKLVQIWSEILAVDVSLIGIKDNFFDLGGHSLKVVRFVSRAKKDFDIDFNYVAFFNHPTIEEIHDEIEKIYWVNNQDVEAAEMNENMENFTI